MTDTQLKDKLKELLGNNAYSNSFQVNEDFATLAKCVEYLVTQLKITRNWCNEEGTDHVNEVLDNAYEILNKR